MHLRHKPCYTKDRVIYLKKGLIRKILAVILIIALVTGLENYAGIVDTTVKAADAFETSINGFPESYKTYLRKLHNKYPNWKFVPDNTGVDFFTAVENEASHNRSLIENAYSKYLKSNLAGDYNASTGKYIAKDGSSWVSASKNCVAYFMDPRNFLDENHIYMFEQLAYDSSSQTQAGVEAILQGSFMYKNNIGYIDTAGKYQTTNTLYSAQIMTAAKTAKVSAYHIASKILQEIGSKANSKYAGMGASGSITGTYSKPYTGIYNFYNIGATSSANPIANGLKWAKSGSTYQRPWNTPQKSILGGAQYLGEKYINAGQNTMYLQRFNVKSNGTYSIYTHQYMTNISGAASEAASTADAYQSLGIAAHAKTFVIPVFNNMPNESNTITLGIRGNKKGVANSDVNVRKGPATSYDAVGVLPKNQAVTVTEVSNTDIEYGVRWLSNPYWYKVSFVKDGKKYTGYVSAAYVNLKSEYTIAKTGRLKLPTTLKTSEQVYYLSDNPAIATVDDAGNIKGIGAGTVTIHGFTAAGKSSVSTINVLAKSIHATGIKLNKTTLKLKNGTKEKLKAKVTPNNTTDGNVTWKSSNKKIAKVTSRGNVYAKSVGECTVTATTANGKKVTCKVKVVPGTATIKATNNGYNSIKLTWNKLGDVTGYWIYRKTPGSKYKTIAKVSGTTVSYKDKNLVTGKKYYYKIKGYKKVGKTTYKGSKSKASKAYPKPAKVKITSIKSTAKGAKLYWKKVAGASGYVIYRSESKTGKYTKIKEIKKQKKIFYNNTGLLKGKTYYYKVMAYRNMSGIYVYGKYSTVKQIRK